MSDYDIAIASKSLFLKAKDLGIEIRGQGTRTKPLSDAQTESLGLDTLKADLDVMTGRDVSFMIYESPEAITARGDAIFLE